MSITIDNSAQASTTGVWSNPGARLYDRLNAEPNRQALIREAYLITPNVLGPEVTYTASNVGYPHHVVHGGKLIVHRKAVIAAFSRARQQGVFSGPLAAHLKKHYRELGLMEGSEMEEVSHAASIEGDVKKLMNLKDSGLTLEDIDDLVNIVSRNMQRGVHNTKAVVKEVKRLLAQFKDSRLAFDEYMRLVRAVANHHQRLAMDANMEHSSRLDLIVTNILRHNNIIDATQVFYHEPNQNGILSHHGIMGMRWGVRRYRGPDGTVVPGKYKSPAKAEQLRREGGNNAPLSAGQQAGTVQTSTQNPNQRQQATKVDTTPTTNPAHESPSVVARRVELAKKGKLNSQNLTTQQIQNIVSRINAEKQLADLTRKERSRSQKFVDRALKEVGDASWRAFNKGVTKKFEHIAGDLLGVDLRSKEEKKKDKRRDDDD